MFFRLLIVLSLVLSVVTPAMAGGAPFNIVYGWFPNWIAPSATNGLDATQLTHLSWFSCEVDTASGSLMGVSAWRTTPVVAWAKANGVRVHLTITCFGTQANRALLSVPSRRTRCIAEIASALRLQDADGVNLDFEAVGGSERANLISFVQELRDSLPNKEITMATPAVDWSNAFDLATLSRVCDFLLLMGYDYYWSGSETAGPVAPLGGESYNVGRSVDTYLRAGVDPLRLVLAVPLYAREWTVVGPARKAARVQGSVSTAYRFSDMQSKPGADARLFDDATGTSWFNHTSGSVTFQTWWDDSLSLVKKYRFIQLQQLRGVGYWALGYDGGLSAVWDGLRSLGTPSDVADEPLYIDNNERVDVYDLRGRLVYSCVKLEIPLITLLPGVYVLRSRDGRVERFLR
ncbi:MAG: glycosyl hydrolase family 18 protein [Candidatus Kapabacteria bacterium]|nr:glycosyl hydrolase family 18 protein [Candidatus Kapabacteria bacterium]